MIISEFRLLVAILVITSGSGAFAKQDDSPPLCIGLRGVTSPTELEVKKKLAQSWSSSKNASSKASVQFAVGDDGKIYEPEIIHSSGDDQFDAECLEAVCSMSPLNPRQNITAQMTHFIKNFGPKGDSDLQKSHYVGTDVQQYLRTHQQSSDSAIPFVLVHKIPLSVLWRYPKYFTQAELINPGNLLELKVRDDPNHRTSPAQFLSTEANLYAYWDCLFKQPKVTKTDIVQYAKGSLRAGE